jgi:hypothetical protein
MATITYKTFDVSNLRLETPVENKLNADMTKYQLMSLPKYLKDGKDFIPQIQGPWMNLSTYGIPGKNDKSGKPILNQAGQPLSDYERGRMKIPFDLTDPEVKKFYDVLSDIDTHCENQKEKIFGAKAAKAYKYAPIIRTPPEDPLAEEGAAVKPNSMTVKFDFDYKSKEIKSKVYVNTDGDRAEVATPTVDAVQKYVRYKSDFRLVFAISKFYATKAADTTDGKRKYGFGLKLKHIEVKPSSVSPQDEQENAFVEDDEDEVVERRALVSEPKVEKKVAAPTKAAKPVVEDEETEEEEEKPVVKKTTKAAKPVVEEEEEEEEEEETKAPPPKTAARRGRTRTSAV